MIPRYLPHLFNSNFFIREAFPKNVPQNAYSLWWSMEKDFLDKCIQKIIHSEFSILIFSMNISILRDLKSYTITLFTLFNLAFSHILLRRLSLSSKVTYISVLWIWCSMVYTLKNVFSKRLMKSKIMSTNSST